MAGNAHSIGVESNLCVGTYGDLRGFFEIGMDRYIDNPVPFPVGPRFSILNLGPGEKHINGATEFGYETEPQWIADEMPLPCKDDSVDGIHCYHFLEHVAWPVRLLAECQRVLRVGGLLNIVVPYADSHMAVQDMTHINRFNEDSWKVLLENPHYKPIGSPEEGWRLHINTNFIMGLTGQNLALFTQLEKD